MTDMTDDISPSRAARVLFPMPQPDGTMCYRHNLTSKDRTDLVQLRVDIVNALPIVFVPGVMGSNLKSIEKKGPPVWRLNSFYIPTVGEVPAKLALGKFREGAGDRQKLLHPDRTEVDPGGNVPTKPAGSIFSNNAKQLEAIYRARRWGEVGESSYRDFLLMLEDTLNGHRAGKPATEVEAKIAALMASRAADPADQVWRPQKDFVASAPDDFHKLRKWFFPVYAFGYNWLQDNAVAAKFLQQRIKKVIAENNNAASRCEQVIVVTHSMGGLVARACQQLDDMKSSIAGIVHGVMPVDGAPVAYRRCKLGVVEEDYATGVVIGKTGQEVTAVFAQAPGALELLPTQRYKGGWLEVRGPDGKTPVQQPLPVSDPYFEIYKRRDRWWALVKEEWLAPKDGAPIKWNDYVKFISMAEAFHKQVLAANSYHPNTYAFYGADSKEKTKSFESIVWQMKRGKRADDKAPTPNDVYGMTAQQVQMDGANPEYVGWKLSVKAAPQPDGGVEFSTEASSHWELRADLADGTGDGTVPAQSGRSPVDCAKVRQVFRLSGVEHEPAYGNKSPIARQVTLYAISKIALEARVPQGGAVKAKS
ncbi:hypothetical protein WKW77_06440 [Variovorax ureilyticus]|uniref:GPI inositol-deacylase PGAP1-like alpha/beta domain-containing protein n=1 Tax=Variovorax ureilyticus TaxID=1836198 RepID=A0ABU8VAK8_9BURK